MRRRYWYRLRPGGFAEPFETYHNALGRGLFLRIATELYLKQLIVGGMDKVFEIGKIFRNEGIDADHNPEFTTMESYEAYADYNDVMRMTEEMVAFVAEEVNGTTVVPVPDGEEGETIDLAPPWPRLDLREAIIDASGIDFRACPTREALVAAMDERGMHVEPNSTWQQLLDKVISASVEPRLVAPTFLVDYPLAMSPLAKKKPGFDDVVERFEAFVLGVSWRMRLRSSTIRWISASVSSSRNGSGRSLMMLRRIGWTSRFCWRLNTGCRLLGGSG